MIAAPARHEPRFVYLCEAIERDPLAVDDGDAGARGRYVWRLDAANHRTLGRGTSRTDTFERCRASVERVRDNIDRLNGAMTAGDRRSAWTWRVDLDGEPVAVSSHAYLRRVECSRGLAQFLDVLTTADPARGVIRNIGPLSARSFELVWGVDG